MTYFITIHCDLLPEEICDKQGEAINEIYRKFDRQYYFTKLRESNRYEKENAARFNFNSRSIFDVEENESSQLQDDISVIRELCDKIGKDHLLVLEMDEKPYKYQ